MDSTTPIPSPSTGAMLEAFEVVAPTGKRISLHAETNSIMERRETRLRQAELRRMLSGPADHKDAQIRTVESIKAINDAGVQTEELQREIGDWHRFRNRRQVASYTGLCPSEHSSGQSRLQGCINRHGNPRVRHLLIEAVWRLFKFQPQYRTIAKWLPALSALKISGARKKKIIVAIARQLAVDLWRIATGRTTAAALGLQTN